MVPPRASMTALHTARPMPDDPSAGQDGWNASRPDSREKPGPGSLTGRDRGHTQEAADDPVEANVRTGTRLLRMRRQWTLGIRLTARQLLTAGPLDARCS